MSDHQDFVISMILALLIAILFLLLTTGLVSPIRADTRTDLMCMNEPVYLAPAGRPDSIPCSSEIDRRCMEYQPKGN